MSAATVVVALSALLVQLAGQSARAACPNAEPRTRAGSERGLTSTRLGTPPASAVFVVGRALPRTPLPGLATTESPCRVPSVSAPSPPSPDDAWFGADKVRHFALAGFTQAVGFSGATAVGLRQQPAILGASIVTAGVSIGKEVYDHARGRRASVRDLVWDALGATGWTLLLARVEPR